MNFIKQVKAELMNLLKMRFIVVIGIIVLIMGFVVPIISYVAERYYENQENSYGYYYYNEGAEPIVIDGIEIAIDNPFYYEVMQYSEEYLTYIEGSNLNEQQLGYVNELANICLSYYLKYAGEITTYDDYRSSLVYDVINLIPELYALETNPENIQEFEEAINYLFYIENVKDIVAISEEEKSEKIEENKGFIEKADSAILSNDLNDYADCMIMSLYIDIEEYEDAIAVQEAAVIENPDLEDSASAEIERLEYQITTIIDSTIPTWEYRKEHGVYPNSDDWRDNALNEIEYATYRLQESTNVLTEEEFFEDPYWVHQYEDYASYTKAMEKQTLEAQTDILVAQNSLDADKPDMKFASDGARNRVNSNLFYAVIVAVLGILIGGFLIANEFQMGTVRLLMIRPSTRGKIYASKYAAGLIYVYVIYILEMICNIILNGILAGFADYSFPNYSASGPINFWSMIMVRIFVCSITIVFSYSAAYALSALIRNSAIAIALPSAGIFGGMLGVTIVAYTKYAKYIAFTPFPYLNFSGFYSEYGAIQTMIGNGVNLNVATGVIILLVLSFVCYIVGLFCFKKTDITN